MELIKDDIKKKKHKKKMGRRYSYNDNIEELKKLKKILLNLDVLIDVSKIVIQKNENFDMELLNNVNDRFVEKIYYLLKDKKKNMLPEEELEDTNNYNNIPENYKNQSKHNHDYLNYHKDNIINIDINDLGYNNNDNNKESVFYNKEIIKNNKQRNHFQGKEKKNTKDEVATTIHNILSCKDISSNQFNNYNNTLQTSDYNKDFLYKDVLMDIMSTDSEKNMTSQEMYISQYNCEKGIDRYNKFVYLNCVH
ncbi:hypothetical protein PFFCH_04654 [Plasmodium falciparum FCH/4]|uniref:Uncharacterized protein n=1 Tax=Plasmodium falciparum FCH/4 TaxID=1036724 RepID=A0A024VIB5_PLAFA|nr:hypothetical protein PFFCH_04654 [Plasmodium falciparum FCH/4]